MRDRLTWLPCSLLLEIDHSHKKMESARDLGGGIGVVGESLCFRRESTKNQGGQKFLKAYIL